MSSVAVVVPVYKSCLSTTEKISLKQLFHVLGHYPIIFAAPEQMRRCTLLKNRVVEWFPNCCFTSVYTYSKLLLTPQFYEKFHRYEYILICQLDAFVFKDRLEEFCQAGYDYIGAPLPRWNIVWNKIGARIGNGGFSLRKVCSVINVLEKKEEIYKSNKFLKDYAEKYEDLFFGYCGSRSDLVFSVPDVRTAESFSVENDVSHIYRNLDTRLPFGCHGWNRRIGLWKPYIEKCGYRLSGISSKANYPEREYMLQLYLFHRLLRTKRYIWEYPSAQRFFLSRKCCVWGMGDYGRECIELLVKFGVQIDCIYDLSETGSYCSIPIKCSSYILDDISFKFIFLSAPLHRDEQRKMLETHELCYGVDFITMHDWINIVLKEHEGR